MRAGQVRSKPRRRLRRRKPERRFDADGDDEDEVCPVALGGASEANKAEPQK